MKKVLAICGSTRQQSSNLLLIEEITKLAAGVFAVDLYEGIDRLPHFNPDLDFDRPPPEVLDFRAKIKSADGVLICTPEYAMGVPGSLKNALDWVVSTMEFTHKPVSLITASLHGQKGHAALMETLRVIDSRINEDTELVIPFIKTKIKAGEGLTHPATIQQLRHLIAAFDQLMGDH